MQVKLSEAIPAILAYDGQVLECFFDEGGSRRIHLSHIKSLHLDAQGQGKHLLTIQLKREPILLWVDEANMPGVLEFLADVQKGMTG
jgi:hypothetical protein